MGSERRQALPAAFQYLVMGTIGATFFLIGVGLIYAMTGTLNMADIGTRRRRRREYPDRPGRVRVHHRRARSQAGPVPAAPVAAQRLRLRPLGRHRAFLAATATKVAVYTMLRFVFTLFGSDFALDVTFLAEFLMALALAGVFAGSITAIFQNNVKRMLAYSSVAQIGYMLLGVSFFSVTGPHGRHRSPLQPRHNEGRRCSWRWAAVFYRLGSVHDRPHAGTRQADAAHHVRLRARRTEPDRRAPDSRLHQQVVSDPRRPRSAAGGRSPV